MSGLHGISPWLVSAGTPALESFIHFLIILIDAQTYLTLIEFMLYVTFKDDKIPEQLSSMHPYGLVESLRIAAAIVNRSGKK